MTIGGLPLRLSLQHSIADLTSRTQDSIIIIETLVADIRIYSGGLPVHRVRSVVDCGLLIITFKRVPSVAIKG